MSLSSMAVGPKFIVVLLGGLLPGERSIGILRQLLLRIASVVAVGMGAYYAFTGSLRLGLLSALLLGWLILDVTGLTTDQ